MTCFYFTFAVGREAKLAAKVTPAAGYPDQPDRKTLTIDAGGSDVQIAGTTDAAIEAFARQLAGLAGLNVIN